MLPDYVLQVGTSPGRSNVFNASVGSTTGASGALPNGLYYWRVIAVNGAGPSPPSAEAQFAVGCVAPGPPQDLSACVERRARSENIVHKYITFRGF